jgi:hypothetical protein
MMTNSDDTILFFARDPGAADVVCEIYHAVAGNKLFYAKDAAREVCRRSKIPYIDFNAEVCDCDIDVSDREVVRSWLESLGRVSLLISGTTHFDDFTDRLSWEILAGTEAKTVAVLDQWLRVTERFRTPHGDFHPDFCFAPSQSIVDRLRKEALVRKDAYLLGQPFLASVGSRASLDLRHRVEYREAIAREYQCEFETLILYASEPQRQLSEQGSQFCDVSWDEKEVFEELQSAVASAGLKDTLLLVKLHPKEREHYYEDYPFIVRQETEKSHLLAAADIVVGTKSMLLIEAALYGKHVLSIDFWGLEGERLITNEYGLSQKVENREELEHFLREIKGPKSIDPVEAMARLGILMNWSEVLNDFLKETLV